MASLHRNDVVGMSSWRRDGCVDKDVEGCGRMDGDGIMSRLRV